jgi:hypothetical protein
VLIWDPFASIRALLAGFSSPYTVRVVSRWKYLTPLAVLAVLAVSGCTSSKSPAPQSLFEIAHSGVATGACSLAPHGTIELALPALTSYLSGVTPTVEEKSFPASGPDAMTVSCFWETAAGPVTLSVVRGATAPQSMLNSPGVSFKFEGVSFVPLSLAEAIVVKTAPDEAVFLSAPGLVPRSSLIEAARLVVLPSNTKIPELPLPVGARTHIDVFRTSLAIDACSERIEFENPAGGTINDPAFVSHSAGMVDVFPQSDADAYALATLKRVFKAAETTWSASSLQVGKASLPLSCGGAPASIWGFVWDDPTSTTPTSGPLTIEELEKTAVTSNAWRVLIMIASDKPSAPSRTPDMPDVSYNVTQTANPAG